MMSRHSGMSVIRQAYRDARSALGFVKASLRLRTIDLPDLSFYSNEETVDQIVYQGKSLARFGDGEFSWILGEELAPKYQHCSAELSRALSEVLRCDDNRLVIGVLRTLNSDADMEPRAKMYWRKFRADKAQKIIPLLPTGKKFADASITRPYIDLSDRSHSGEAFANLRRIWDGKRLLIVEGEKSRLGIGNDLFDNALSIRRILAPSADAFSLYGEILAAIMSHRREGELVVLALGPTATVLAKDLCVAGCQAVDLGHVDIEYEWFRMGAKKKVPIPGKMARESGIEETYGREDAEFEASVVARVGV